MKKSKNLISSLGIKFAVVSLILILLTLLVFKSWITELITYFFVGATLAQLQIKDKKVFYGIFAIIFSLFIFATYYDPIWKSQLDKIFSVNTVTGPLTLLNLLNNILPLLIGFWVFHRSD